MNIRALVRVFAGVVLLAPAAGASLRPKIGCDTNQLYYAANPSAGPQATIIPISNAGGAALNWRIDGGAPWLTISPRSGVNDGLLTVTVDPAGLEPGRYEASFKIKAKFAVNSPLSVKVTLDVVTDRLLAGFRASRYGIDPFPDPAHWAFIGSEMASRFPGAGQGCVWIVGVFLDNGDCGLNFPSPGGDYRYIHFLEEDQNEAALSFFDGAGLSVWLQVEPGRASVLDLIDLVLRRYGHHACVKGVGVDVEWYKTDASHPEGRPVSDLAAMLWSLRARSYARTYTVFLKHWLIDKMPPLFRRGLWFINDSQQFNSLAQMVNEFRAWGEHFWPSSVGFQFGYEADKPWWRLLADPPRNIGDAIRTVIPNTLGLFWVDFTIRDIFP
mgnify:CR=1 FL=1